MPSSNTKKKKKKSGSRTVKNKLRFQPLKKKIIKQRGILHSCNKCIHVTTNTRTGYFKHAHTMQKYILQQSCNNLILLLWTYEKEVYVFVWDEDEDDIFFFFFFNNAPHQGRHDSSQRREVMYTLITCQEGGTNLQLLSPSRTSRVSRLRL